MPDLSIVIVSWNVRDLLTDCLEAIRSGPVTFTIGSSRSQGKLAIEVIVVDSASNDGTSSVLSTRFPWVKLIQHNENIGFSKGNNIGIAASEAAYVLLLNPDTKVLNDALPKMVGYMIEHPQVGMLGPQLLNEDLSVQSSRRRFPTLCTALFESTWLQPYAPPKVLKNYYMFDIPDDATARVDWVTGAAMLVRRQVIDEVGGFDESFFMYSEELDWQRRIKAAGWEIVYYPEAKIMHYGGKSSDQIAAQRHIYFQTSKVHYFYKYHGACIAFILRTFLLANYAWQLFLEVTKGALGSKREMRYQRIVAYWQVLRSRLKDA